MTEKSDNQPKPQPPEPEQAVPPRQNDPLLGDYFQKSFDPKKKGETREK
jgi:hypothetical protein